MSEKQMKKKIKMIIWMCLILFSFITEKTVYAHAGTSATISVIFDQQFVDEDNVIVAGADKELVYEIVAKVPGSPMPVGSVGDVFEITLKGNVGTSVDILFSQSGVFEYTLRASDKNDLTGLKANDEVYYITINARSTMAGDLQPLTVVKNEDGEKVVDPPFEYTIVDGSTSGPGTIPSGTTPPGGGGGEVGGTGSGGVGGAGSANPDGSVGVGGAGTPERPNRTGIIGSLTRPGELSHGSSGAKTGDDSLTTTWMITSGVALVLIILLIGKKRKRIK